MPAPPEVPPPKARFWARVALALVFVLLACLGLRQVAGGDVGFHLAAGGRILDGLGWPRDDPFTFTVPDHAYVDTSWGYQVVLALLERGFGAPGLVVFHAALVLALWWLLYRTVRLAPADPWAVVLLVALGGLAAEMRYEVRPEMLSYTLLALVLYLLHRHAEGGDAPLALLPAIFLVWANCHSLFVLGWLALGSVAAGLWLRDRRPDRRLLGWSLASAAVAFVNPYGWRGVAFPFTLLTRFREENPFNDSIGEFVSPFDLALSDQFPFYPRLPISCFRLFSLLVLLSLVPLASRRRFTCLILALPFGYLSCSMVRNLPLLVIAGLPGLAWGLAGRPGRPRAWWRPVAGVVGAVALVLALRVVHDGYYIDSRRQDRFGLGWNEHTQPVAAAAWAERAGLWGPVLNHLNFGGYLIWARKQPVFIDGRLEVMGEAFFDRYRRILDPDSSAEREAAVRRHAIEWTVFPYRLNPKLLGALHRDPKWTLAYVDHLAAIYVRTERAARLVLDPSARRPPGGPPVETEGLPGLGATPRVGAATRWLRGLVRRERFPGEPFERGLFDYFRGDAAGAALQFAEAIRQSEGAYYETYLNLGSALYRVGRLAEARECYRVVLADAPGNDLARERMAEIEGRLSGP